MKLKHCLKTQLEKKIHEALLGGPGKKHISALAEEWKEKFTETFPEGNVVLAMEYYDEQINNTIHEEALENNKRADGRAMDKVRPLFAQAGGVSQQVLHGSGIFYSWRNTCACNLDTRWPKRFTNH